VPIKIEHVDFFAIPTEDVARSRAFYLDTIGLPLDNDKPNGFEVTAGQLTLSIWQPSAFGFPFAASTSPIALHVDDVPAAKAELESAGVQFMGDILDTTVCHMAYFSDPDGNALMLHHRYAPVE
jgi:predicted enzyme related to lactoylglutathione lyase